MHTTLRAALLAALLATLAAAQNLTVEVANTGAVGLPGVCDVALPVGLSRDAVFTGRAANGATFLAVKGRQFGPNSHGIEHLTLYSAEWPPGESTVELVPAKTLQAGPANWRPHPLVGDNPADLFPSITIRGVPIAWDLSAIEVYTNALERVFELVGVTESGPQVSARVEITVGYDCPYFSFEGQLVYSDLANPAPILALDSVDEVSVRFAENAQFDRRVEDMILRDGDDDLHAAASYGFSGRVLAQPVTRADFAAYTPTLAAEPGKPDDNALQWPEQTGELLARLHASQWQDRALVHRRIVNQDPTSPRVLQPALWKLPTGWDATGRTGPRQIDRPAQTGGRNAFGTFAGQEAFYVPLPMLRSLVSGAYEESLRAIHHREADGQPVDLRDHPDVRTYNSLPDSRARQWGATKLDLLSFGQGIQEGTLWVQDESHMAHTYTILAEVLGGSAVARWTREAQTEITLGSLDWYAQIQRAVGRPLKFLGYSWTLSDADTRARIEAFVPRKLAAVTARIAASGIVDGAEVFPGYIDRNKSAGYPANLGPSWLAGWSPFQQALLVDGVLVWRLLAPELVDSEMWKQQLRICRTVVAHAFREDPRTGELAPYYVVGWKEDGTPIVDPVDGDSVIVASSVRAFRLTIAVCAAVVAFHDPAAPQDIIDQATRILGSDCCDWDWGRWLGVFLG